MSTQINNPNCQYSKFEPKNLVLLETRVSISDEIYQRKLEKIAQIFIATLSPKTKLKMNGRLERGLALAIHGNVKFLPNPKHPRFYRVLSSERNTYYYVDLDSRTCTCADCMKGNICKHRIAAYYVEQASKSEYGKPIPVRKPDEIMNSRKTTEQLLTELGFDVVKPKAPTFKSDIPSKGLGGEK